MPFSRIVTWFGIVLLLTLSVGAYWFFTREFKGQAAETTNIAHTEALTATNLGLQGYWTLDGNDIKWSDTTTEIKDTSGNSRHGDAQGSLATTSVTPGRVGQSLLFNGTSDLISLGNVYNGIKTVSFWVKPNSTTQPFIDLNGTATINMTSGTVAANNFTSPSVYIDGTAQGVSAPTLVSTSGSTWNDTTTTETTGLLSWQTGDLVVVIGMVEDQLVSLSTPTATGLTFSAVSGFPINLVNTCKGYAWTATAGSNGTGTITSGTESYMAGIQAYVFRGSDGIGNTAQTTSGTALTLSLTRNYDNSMVVWAAGDWGATNDTTVSSDPVGGNQRQAAWISGKATLFAFDWGDQGSAGTTSYGISGFSPGNTFTKIALEIRGSSHIISDTNWHHVAVTTNTGINASATNIGKISSSYFGGTMDDIRLYSTALSSTQVADLYQSSGAKETDNASHRDVLTNGLVGYWTFDGRDIKWSDTGIEIKNISGNANHGAVSGLSATSVVPGKLGQGMSFDGVDESVDVPFSTILNLPNAGGSAFVWVRFADDVSLAQSVYMTIFRKPIIDNWNADGGYRLVLYQDGPSDPHYLRAYLGSENDVDTIYGSTEIKNNQWYLVGLVWDLNNAYIYLNGSVDGSETRTKTINWQEPTFQEGLLLGHCGASTGCGDAKDYLEGALDDARIYNRTLSASEVLQLYNLGK